MENCELKFGTIVKTVSTQNVTTNALIALFQLDETCSVFLKDTFGDSYVFPDHHGTFPTLDVYASYTVEVQPTKGNRTRKRQSNDDDVQSSTDSEQDFRKAAYRLANAGSKKKQRKAGEKCASGGGYKGKRPVPTAVSASHEWNQWYYKITVADWENKKLVPVKNCLIQCNDYTDINEIRKKIAFELKVHALDVVLFDSDYLPIEESPGRIGKYWSGTRKIFAVVNKVEASCSANSSSGSPVSSEVIEEAIQPLSSHLQSLENKMVKMQLLLVKGCSNVFKDIALFAKEMFKCPICLNSTKDEVPHATSCCNHVFCINCANQLVQRENPLCPLCKQKRGPLYPILLSGVKDLVEKIACIPDNNAEESDSH